MFDAVACQKCNKGSMLPLSDYGQEGASILYKAWVCSSPNCGFNIRIDRGEITYGGQPSPNTKYTRYTG